MVCRSASRPSRGVVEAAASRLAVTVQLTATEEALSWRAITPRIGTTAVCNTATVSTTTLMVATSRGLPPAEPGPDTVLIMLAKKSPRLPGPQACASIPGWSTPRRTSSPTDTASSSPPNSRWADGAMTNSTAPRSWDWRRGFSNTSTARTGCGPPGSPPSCSRPPAGCRPSCGPASSATADASATPSAMCCRATRWSPAPRWCSTAHRNRHPAGSGWVRRSSPRRPVCRARCTSSAATMWAGTRTARCTRTLLASGSTTGPLTWWPVRRRAPSCAPWSPRRPPAW